MEKLLTIELQDNDSELGGVSYCGETLEDFLYEVGCNPSDLINGKLTLEEVNTMLEESGIEPIDPIEVAIQEMIEVEDIMGSHYGREIIHTLEELQEVFVLDLEPLNDLVGKGETLEMVMSNIDNPKLKFILINNGIDYNTYVEKMFTKEQKREWYQDHVATHTHLVNKLKLILKNAYLTKDQINTLARKIEEDFRRNDNGEYEDYNNFKEYVNTFTVDNLKQHLN